MQFYHRRWNVIKCTVMVICMGYGNRYRVRVTKFWKPKLTSRSSHAVREPIALRIDSIASHSTQCHGLRFRG